MWVRARAPSSGGAVSLTPAWYRVYLGTNPIKHRPNVWPSSLVLRVLERSWLRVPIRSCAFSSHVTLYHSFHSFSINFVPFTIQSRCAPYSSPRSFQLTRIILSHLNRGERSIPREKSTKLAKIRTHIQPSNPKREITNITNSQNRNRTYGQPSEQLFAKRWPLSNRNRTKNNMNKHKVKRHQNSDTKTGKTSS